MHQEILKEMFPLSKYDYLFVLGILTKERFIIHVIIKRGRESSWKRGNPGESNQN